MKPLRGVCSQIASIKVCPAMIRRFAFFCLVLLWSGAAFAQSLSRTETTDGTTGTIIEFLSGEYVSAVGSDYPQTGWQNAENPNMNFTADTYREAIGFRTMAGRFYFDRSAIGDSPAAIYVMGTRGNFSVSINDQEIFRNYADTSDQRNSWYRPFLIPVPARVLEPNVNEILIHSFTRKMPGIGRVFIGSNAHLEQLYKTRFFWHITAPLAANFATLVLGYLVFVIWIGRRQEIELLWFSAATVLWFMRNHHYYAAEVPFHVTLYHILTFYPAYFGVMATAAFYLCFIKAPKRTLMITLMLLVGIVIFITNRLFGTSVLAIYLPTLIVICLVSVYGIRDLRRHRTIDHKVLAFVMLLLPFVGVYDVTLLIRYEAQGHGTYLSPFFGALFATAFLISFVKRAVDAFSDLGKSNLILEESIAQKTTELAESEAIRRELIVDQAIATERGRLMQEMHDGIGSNLTTALAVARKQNQPDTTVTVLRRALGDLKLTVDSLEPVGGDLVSLLGNLRHRMARDLADAGITCKWKVEHCKPLTWLDATNALHVLRIHNEVISNVLA
ncbi:sensor histidine kinase, partial [Yoonia sp.]|uniref:sensor histidine kinase n=1 Tax=Yoonia sp. TaxID=2212373 RepID=UPI003F4AD7DC